MRFRFSALPAILLLASASSLTAQSLAIGARAGTLGIGPEVAVGLSDWLAVRGGIGYFPLDLDDVELEDLTYAVDPPKTYSSLGVDFYPGGGPFRLMGGLIFRSGNIEVSTSVSPGDEVGGIVMPMGGGITGEVEQETRGPFFGIGFGKHTSGGFGLFLDLAVAVLGSPEVVLSPDAQLAQVPGITQALAQEEERIKDEISSYLGDDEKYLEYWPILSLGFKIPVGGRR